MIKHLTPRTLSQKELTEYEDSKKRDAQIKKEYLKMLVKIIGSRFEQEFKKL